MQLFKHIVAILWILFTLTSTAQKFRYSDQLFDEIDTLKNVEYAEAEWLNNTIDLLSEYNINDGESKTTVRPLYMDIFMPRNDTVSKRPAIIFSHSGAFLKGSRLSDDMIAFCDSFAQRGYVTGTIDYRLGMGAKVTRFLGAIVGLSVDEENAYRAAYRATQDGRAAIRFLKQNAAEYGIDSSKIFMVGSSAGAIQALSTLYLDKTSEIPEAAFTEPSLGGLDSVGIRGLSSKPAAVVSMWGASWNTKQIENNTTPLLLIHGEEDDVVPFKKGIPLEGSVPDNPFVQFNMPETYGSFCIDTALVNRGIPHQSYFVKGQKHEFYGVDTGMFPPEGPNEYWDTIHQKISRFLLDQFQPNAEFEYQVHNNILTTVNASSALNHVFWDFGDGETSTEQQPAHEYKTNGKFKVTLKVCNENMACDTSSQNISVDQLTQILEHDLENVLLYPNPVSDRLNISGLNSPFRVRIIDLTGRTRLSLHEETRTQIDLSSLPAGIYILELKVGAISLVRKISKIE